MATFTTKSFFKHDDYKTPFHAWEDIKEYIPKDKVIWSPFYCDGKQKEHFAEMGFDIIHEPKDFFSYTPEYDIVIDNPPFSQSKEVMKRLAKLDKPFIIIMPSSKINTSYFREYFMNKGLQIIIPRKRIHFTKLVDGKIPDKWKNACNFDCFYYCYKINLPNDITWLI